MAIDAAMSAMPLLPSDHDRGAGESSLRSVRQIESLPSQTRAKLDALVVAGRAVLETLRVERRQGHIRRRIGHRATLRNVGSVRARSGAHIRGKVEVIVVATACYLTALLRDQVCRLSSSPLDVSRAPLAVLHPTNCVFASHMVVERL